MTVPQRLTEDQFKSITLKKFFKQAIPDKKKVRFILILFYKKSKKKIN